MMRPKIIVMTFIILILFMFTFINLIDLNIWDGPFSTVYEKYINNSVILAIYIASIILDLMMILLIVQYILFDLRNKEKAKYLNRISLIIVSLLSIFLIWFEYYWGTTFYYGEIQRNANNFGLAGSILFSMFVLMNLNYGNIKRKFKIFILCAGSLLVILIHIILYNILAIKWKILI